MIRIEPRPDPVVSVAEETEFRRFVQDAFGMRRKQMRRVLRSLWSVPAERADEALASCHLDPTARPETLSPQNFADLVRARRRSNLVPIRQREAETFELHRHVDRLHGDVGGRLKLGRREVQNRLHARS